MLKERDEKQQKDVLSQQEKEAESALETRFLTPDNAVFTATKGGFVSLRYGEKEYKRVLIYRTFPFTDPERFLSIREPEGNNGEIGLIDDLAAFDDRQIALLREQLALRYFMPVIRKILEIKEEYGYSYWNVETSSGACRFTCDANGVSKLSETRLVIADVDGNRFEIPDVTRLSAKELRMVDLYM